MQLEFGGRRYPVAADDLVIGSDPGSTLHLPAPGVLPRHAVVRRLQEGMAVVSAGTAGAEILLNGTPLGPDPTPVMHGDKLRIGTAEVAVSDPRRTGATVVQPVSGPAGLPIDPVVDATAASPPRLVSLADGREYRVEVVPFVLGRDAVCEVVVESGAVSRRHAEIVARHDGDVLVDLSSNGTWVNGQRVDGRRVLVRGDVIKIGDEEFRYYPVDAPVPPPGAEFRLGDTLANFQATPRKRATPFLPPSEPPLASLFVKSGARQGERFAVRTPVVNIGRADYNDFTLPDASVSASHAKLQLREGVWTLADLGSTNGTRVDGEAVSGDVALSPGATVAVGEVKLLFEPRDTGVKAGSGTVVLEAPVLAAAQAAHAAQLPAGRGAASPASSPWRRPVVAPRPSPARRLRTWVIAAVIVALGAYLLFG